MKIEGTMETGPNQDFGISSKSPLDVAYEAAAALTGTGDLALQSMARKVFGAMLHHASRNPGEDIWTRLRITPNQEVVNKLDVEVNTPPVRPEVIKALRELADYAIGIKVPDCPTRAHVLANALRVLQRFEGRKP